MIKLARLPLLLAAILACAAALALPAAAQQPDADYSEFYQALEPHGQWIQHPRWGLVWSPNAQQDESWRPYSRGQWVYTDEHGWYWETEEDWGWAPYHYGRWIFDEDFGWIWIPGREWGPAWVTWRYSDDYVGWAPLPPEAVWEPDRGEVTFAYTTYESPRWAHMWCFVPIAYIATPRVWHHFAPRYRNAYFVGRTRYVPAYTVVDRRVFNRGLDVRLVERFSRQPVPRVQVRLIDNPRDNSWRRGGGERRVVGAYRPSLAPDPKRPAVLPHVVPGDRARTDRVNITPQGREGQPDRFGRGLPRGPQGPNDGVTARERFEGSPRGAYGGPAGFNLPKGNAVPDPDPRSRFKQPQAPGPGANLPPRGNGVPDPNPRARVYQQPTGPTGRGPEVQRTLPPQRPAVVNQPPRAQPPQAAPRQAAPAQQNQGAQNKQVNKGPDPRRQGEQGQPPR